MTKRKLIFILGLYLLGLLLFTFVLHEISHIAAALIIGVPWNEIRIGWYGINPNVSFPERFAGTDLWLYYYSGGITAGVVSIIIYMFWYRKLKRNPSVINWMLALTTIAFAGPHLAQGYNEGRFHVAYMYYAGSLFNVLNVSIWLAFLIAVLIHFVLFPIATIKKGEISHETEDS